MIESSGLSFAIGPSRTVPNLVFIQRTRLGRSIFELRDNSIEVTSLLLGQKRQVTIPIRLIASDYELVAERSYLLIGIPLALSIACFGLLYLVLLNDFFPQYFALYPAIFGFAFLWGTFRGVPRVEFFVFRDQWRRQLFSVIRERSQAQECEAFVGELLERIVRAEPISP